MFSDGKGGIYDRCPRCHKLVKLNKCLFGSLHICDGGYVLCDECGAHLDSSRAHVLPDSWLGPKDTPPVYACPRCYRLMEDNMKDIGKEKVKGA